MTHDFASITEMPGTLLSPEQYARYLHRYALGLRESGLRTSPARVLEVGCGGGSGTIAWHNAADMAGGSVVGLEYVPEALYAARLDLGDALPLVGGDAQHLPFANASFDVVASFEVIYYLPNLSAFLSESRRVLAPEGKLILCWANPEWETFVPGKLSHSYPTLTEAASLLNQTGFDTVDFFGAFATPQRGAKAKWVNRLRQLVVRSGLSSLLSGVATPLMRAAYGKLTPLPERLNLDEIATFLPQTTPLLASSRDHLHRVLYAVASPHA